MQYLFNITLIALLFYVMAIMVDPGLTPEFIPDMDWSYQIDGWLILSRDKLGHFFLMGFAALLMNVLLGAKRVHLFSLSFLLGSLIMVIIVTLEELRQVPLADRNFEIFDLFYNFAGIFILGRIGAWLVRNYK